MDNRPHSREKRYSNTTQSVNKTSFTSGTSRGAQGSRSSGNTISILALLAFLFGKNSKSGIGKIIRIILIAFILYEIASFLFSGVGSIFSSNSNNNNITNNIPTINEHTDAPIYVEDVSSENVDLNVSSGARNKYTTILGNNKDEVTVMVYMIGTDLESGYGAASKDLYEMYYAGIKDNINIVVETGGCKNWQLDISNNYIERYTVNSEGLHPLQTKIKSEAMTNPNVLSDFIRYASNNFPANRYMLILWDHGGGSVTGYGYDEKYPYAESMSPALISEALRNGGVKFDIVGFDACLMANLETAIAVEPYADYLIGSEETEPGGGWYYTNWLKQLDSNTSIKTVELGKYIIDDYIDQSLSDNRNAQLTESIIDLAELKYQIAKPLSKFANSLSLKLNNEEYNVLANARSKTKEFSRSSGLDQVDLIDLANSMNLDGSNELITGLKKAIKYNRTANINNSYGLSAYFPYSSLSKMSKIAEIYDEIDMDEDYSKAVKAFATYASSGQIVNHNYGSSGTSLFDVLMDNDYSGSNYSSNDIYSLLFNSLTGNNGYSNYYDGYSNEYGYGSYSDLFGGGSDWIDSSLLSGISNYFGRNHLDASSLKVTKKNGQRVISLSEEEWSLIDTIMLQMFIDDGEGYIDLGMDNSFEFNNDGDLIAEADGTWLTLNNHFIAYYLVSDEYISDNNYRITGKIPALLNNQRVDIMVEFTDKNPYGKVLGAKPIYEDNDSQLKGLIDIEDGDSIIFLCNYYSYDGELLEECQLGNTLIVNGSLELYNTNISNDYVYTYCFLDHYGNKMWAKKMSK